MSANYLHGAESITLTTGGVQVRQVKTAVIGLVGTAPVHLLAAANRTVNELAQILSATDAGLYGGPAVSGFTIPQALDAIFDQGAGTVMIVNVFDPAKHKTAVAAENATFAANDQVILAQGAKSVISAVVKNATGDTTYVEDTDYSLDRQTGTLTRLSGGAIASGATVQVSYDVPDLSAITAADIIGAVGADGERTGMQEWLSCYNAFGFHPKILIAPGYCTLLGVATELDVLADKLRAIALVDAPAGTTRDGAINGRGPEGEINFQFSNFRTALLFPHLKVYDSATDADRLEPYSQRFAGVIAATDIDEGYHVSPSNKEIKGITGVEVKLYASVNDPSCDVNALNEAGIVTVFNAFGSGFRTWGNRASAYPNSTDPRNFIAIQRTFDVVDESIELAALQFVDRPITKALIDSILDTCNGFIRTLIGRRALYPGSVAYYDPTRNEATELAAGHLVISRKYMAPPPAERITFENTIDINLVTSVAN